MEVNKQELADILRCALPTLDRLMARYGDSFPVVQHGAKGREYRFDPEAVISFVQAREAERRATDAQRDELMAQFTIPGIEPAAAGLKPSDQLALARARGLAREQAREAGFLVETSKVRQLLTTLLSRLRRDMGTAVRQTLRDANIPEAIIRSIEARIAEAQRRFVADTQAALQTEGADDAEPALL